jgi:hypothetical protein
MCAVSDSHCTRKPYPGLWGTWTLQMIWYSVIVCHALAAAHVNKFTFHKDDIWKSAGHLHKMQVSLFNFLLESHEVIWLSDFGVCQNLSIAAAYRPIRELLESEQQQVTQKTFYWHSFHTISNCFFLSTKLHRSCGISWAQDLPVDGLKEGWSSVCYYAHSF